MRPIVYTIGSLANDDDGIVTSTTASGAGNLTLDGVLVSGGVATLPYSGAKVTITNTGNTTGVTFVVFGTNPDTGGVIAESVPGSAAATITTTNYFATVTAITVSGAFVDAIKIGYLTTNGIIGKAIPLNWRANPINQAYQLNFNSLTANAKVQFTDDNIQDPVIRQNGITWFDWDAGNKSANFRYPDTTSWIAARLVINSASQPGFALTGVTLTIVTAGSILT